MNRRMRRAVTHALGKGAIVVLYDEETWDVDGWVGLYDFR